MKYLCGDTVRGWGAPIDLPSWPPLVLDSVYCNLLNVLFKDSGCCLETAVKANNAKES